MYVPRIVSQVIRFAGVGASAFVIDWGVMVLLTELFGVPYLVSTTIGFAVATIFNYFMSMRYVFAHKEELSRRREFIVFVVLSVVGLGINDLLMWLGVSLAGIDYRITKVVVTIIVSVFNFVTRKVFLDASPEG